MDSPEEAPPLRGGGALAVDLRRARAAAPGSGARHADRGRPAAARPAPLAPVPGVLRAIASRSGACASGSSGTAGSRFRSRRKSGSAYLAGESGLIHAATGTGKTYAAWMGPVLEWLRDYPARRPRRKLEAPPLRVLWVTPLRALAGDTEAALRAPVEDLGLPWTVESRTGDTPARVRARQRERLPTALVTTPESLSLLLTREDATSCSSILSWWSWTSGTSCSPPSAGSRPSSRSPGCGGSARASARWASPPRSAISSRAGRTAGRDRDGTSRARPNHAGARAQGAGGGRAHPGDHGAVPLVGTDRAPPAAGGSQRDRGGRSALVFTNTRATAEIWYQALLAARPDWAGIMALHHGSLDRATREWVEDGLRDGRLRCVVCTSTLDLGVDFTPVDRVLQVGSPKSVGRLVQRAGRSGHQPGAVSRLTCVPTNALELVDVAAARDALEAGAHRGAPAGGAAARSAGAARRHPGARRRFSSRRAATRRCGRRGPTAASLPPSGPGSSTSSPAAATRSAPTPSTARWWWRTAATS